MKQITIHRFSNPINSSKSPHSKPPLKSRLNLFVKTLLLFFFILTNTLNLSAQSFLNGFVLDSTNQPIPWVANIELYADSIYVSSGNETEIGNSDSIWVRPIKYFSRSGNTGAFHLLIEDEKNINIKVSAFQHLTKEIHLDSIPPHPIIINMEIDTAFDYNKVNSHYSSINRNRKKMSAAEVTMGMDFLEKDFGQFEPLLGKENTEFLSQMPFLFTLEYGMIFKKIYTSLEYGLIFHTDSEDDGINRESTGNLFALHLGYQLLSRHRSFIMPKVSIKRYRYRFIESIDVEEDVSLPNYISDPDLDLRFVQPTADFGLTIGFKYYGKNPPPPGNYILFGMHAGYAVSLRDKAKVQGTRTLINRSEGIDIGRLSMSFNIRFHFQ